MNSAALLALVALLASSAAAARPGGPFVQAGRALLDLSAAEARVQVEPKADNDGTLTPGWTSTSWWQASRDSAQCMDFDTSIQNWVNSTAVPTLYADPNAQPPPLSSYASLSEQFCSQGAAAGPALVEAFAAGGQEATDAMAALWFGQCTDSTAFQNAYSAFVNSPNVSDSSQVLTLAKNFVGAARELGLAACVTITVLDRSNKTVDVERVYTPGGGGGGASPPPSSAPLPAGEVSLSVNWGPNGAVCSEFDASAASGSQWKNGTGPAWTASGSGWPADTQVNAFASDMCGKGSEAGPLLTEALAAGGDKARVAVAALTTKSCSSDKDRQDAISALLNAPELQNSTTVMTYATRFVEACDAIGLGCCFSVAVTDSNGDVLATRQVHTSEGGGAAPAPSPGPSGGPSLAECKDALQTAYSGCTGSAIIPGSACCNAIEGLGSGCLAVLQAAAQSGSDPVLAVAVPPLLEKCDIVVSGPTPGASPPATAPSPSPAPGSSPIPPGGQPSATCLTGFTTALAACGSATTVVPGSQCCAGIQALGVDCLKSVGAFVAGTSSANTQFQTILTGCQIALPGAGASPSLPSSPAPGASPSLPSPPLDIRQCATSFANAINATCPTDSEFRPGTACCSAVAGVGNACLAAVQQAAAANATLSNAIQAILGGCNITLTTAAPPPGGNATLPAGQGIRSFWVTGKTAQCWDFDAASGNFTNSTTSSVWKASGSSFPSESALTDPLNTLCSANASTSSQQFAQAVLAGGPTAQAWVAAMLGTNCSLSYDSYREWVRIVNGSPSSSAVAYVQQFVAACDAIGVGACITLVSLDAAGNALGSVQIHTSANAGPPTITSRRLLAAQLLLGGAAKMAR